MNQDRNKLLSKIAYLYYIENLNQSQIAAKLGIYRTSISRMLTEARNAGIVKIEIENFDTNMFKLENYVKEKSHDEYSTAQEKGLTIYNYGSNAAWVSGGILYTIDGDAPLSPDQIRKIATSV